MKINRLPEKRCLFINAGHLYYYWRISICLFNSMIEINLSQFSSINKYCVNPNINFCSRCNILSNLPMMLIHEHLVSRETQGATNNNIHEYCNVGVTIFYRDVFLLFGQPAYFCHLLSVLSVYTSCLFLATMFTISVICWSIK